MPGLNPKIDATIDWDKKIKTFFYGDVYYYQQFVEIMNRYARELCKFTQIKPFLSKFDEPDYQNQVWFVKKKYFKRKNMFEKTKNFWSQINYKGYPMSH